MEQTQNGQKAGGAPPSAIAPNPFASSGLFVKTADIWTPYKMSFEGFAGGGKTLTMTCVAVGIWEAEGKKGNVILIDTEISAKFITPFVRQFGLIEGKNFFVTHSRDLRAWGEALALCEANRGSILMTDTVTHIYEEMMLQFERDNNRKVKYPQDAMVIKPMWKEKFSNPFTKAINTHLLFTGRAAWEYTMQTDEDTGKKQFNATGVKMRGDNELAYEPDVVVYMERLQKVEEGLVEVAHGANILKDRSRLIDGQSFVFRPWDGTPAGDKKGQEDTWKVFEPVYRMLASGNQDVTRTEADKHLGPLFQKGQGEAWYQARLAAERTVEEIKEVYSQWGIGGTGAVEKMLRATLNLMVFQQRSTVSLVELDPRDLKRGQDEIDHLSRFAAKNIDVIEKMFKANQYEGVSQLLTEEYEVFKAQIRAGAGLVMDDDIADYPVPKGDAGNGSTESRRDEISKMPYVENEDFAAVAKKQKEADDNIRLHSDPTMDDVILSLAEQPSEKAIDDLIVEHAGAISRLSAKERKVIDNAVNLRKRNLAKAGKEAAGAEVAS